MHFYPSTEITYFAAKDKQSQEKSHTKDKLTFTTVLEFHRIEMIVVFSHASQEIKRGCNKQTLWSRVGCELSGLRAPRWTAHYNCELYQSQRKAHEYTAAGQIAISSLHMLSSRVNLH